MIAGGCAEGSSGAEKERRVRRPRWCRAQRVVVIMATGLARGLRL
jgi:hypothetical protein